MEDRDGARTSTSRKYSFMQLTDACESGDDESSGRGAWMYRGCLSSEGLFCAQRFLQWWLDAKCKQSDGEAEKTLGLVKGLTAKRRQKWVEWLRLHKDACSSTLQSIGSLKWEEVRGREKYR